MSDAEHGHGATLTLTYGTSTTTVGNIISIGGPDISRDAIDKSTMDSTNKWREFMPAMLDAGELTMEVNYDGTAEGTANGLNTLFSSTLAPFTATLTLNGGSIWECACEMTALGHAIPLDDKVTQSITLKLTGEPTYTDEA